MEPLQLIPGALKHIAQNQKIKSYLMEHPDIYDIVMRGARRYIGGQTLNECLSEVLRLNQIGIATTIDFCGENTINEKQARAATDEFIRIIDVISSQHLNSSISLDLSHIGSSIDSELLRENLLSLVSSAKTHDIEVMISMENSSKFDLILEEYRSIGSSFSNLGITIQAYLKNQDYSDLMTYPGKLRIVKGAFEENEGVAYPRGKKLDERYLELVEECLRHDKRISIGTHDLDLIDEITKFDGVNACSNVEFEMLHGVNENKLHELTQQGFQTRDYIIYGTEWYLYYCHRLAENPASFIQAFHDMVFNSE